jgi:hypothetical protein
MVGGQRSTGQGPAVDRFGGDVIDPTKNVNDLVAALKETMQELRKADERYFGTRVTSIEAASNARLLDERRFQDSMRAAEAQRINDLAALRLSYDARIAEDLRVGVKTTSDQLASQLIKETSSLSNLIGALRTEFTGQIAVLTTSFTGQIASLTSALTPRMAELERFRWESGGRTSISDPATAEALTKMAQAIGKLSETRSEGKGAATGLDRLITIGALIAAAAMAYATFGPRQPAPVYQAAPPAYQTPRN